MIRALIVLVISLGLIMMDLPLMVVSCGLFLWLALTVKPQISLISAFIYTLLGLLVLDGPFDSIYVLITGIVPVLMGLILLLESHLETIVAKSVIITMGSVILAHLYELYTKGLLLSDVLKDLAIKSLDAITEFPEVSGTVAENLKVVFGYLYPYSMFTYSLFFTMGIFVMAAIFKKLKVASFHTQPLGYFRFKSIASLSFLLVVLGLFLLRNFSSSSAVIVDNLLLISETLFALQGASLIIYYLRQKKLPSGMTLALVLPLLLIPILQQIAGFLGVMDNFWDFRKVEKVK